MFVFDFFCFMLIIIFVFLLFLISFIFKLLCNSIKYLNSLKYVFCSVLFCKVYSIFIFMLFSFVGCLKKFMVLLLSLIVVSWISFFNFFDGNLKLVFLKFFVL